MNRREFVKNGLVGVGVGIASSNVIAKELATKPADKPHINFPSVGNKIIAKVISSEAPCTIGMKPGYEFELGFRKCGDFCGFFYSNIHESIMALQFSDSASSKPGSDIQVFECPNSKNRVKIELRRIAA
ncbi:TIGR04076 family protein [Endozoicomonas sp.]|uniref:TIGR04076 family protein n=1 Tax=Endozoicomonas sp. TaxID=1892382 RepID=UPI003AF4E7D6